MEIGNASAFQEEMSKNLKAHAKGLRVGADGTNTEVNRDKMYRLIDIVMVCGHAVRHLDDVPDAERESLALHVASLLESTSDDAWTIAGVLEASTMVEGHS